MLPNALLISIALVGSTLAHMELAYPAPFNSSSNPHRTTPADPYLQYPYDCCGSGAKWEYPCRGYQSLLGTPDGPPTASWAAGSQQNWSMAGIGNHYGGSCQIGFSIDNGETFRVSTSYEGNCPRRNAGNGPEGQEFPFTVPEDLPPGVHLFAWTWYNREQEFNMNCAAVNITEAAGATESPPSQPLGYEHPSSTAAATASTTMVPATPSYSAKIYRTANGISCTYSEPADISTCDCACSEKPPNNRRGDPDDSNNVDTRRSERALQFSSRPLMLVADDGGGCLTPMTDAELKFPEPGDDIVSGDGEYPLRLPEGDCAGIKTRR